jgi:fumarate reductase subunit C
MDAAKPETIKVEYAEFHPRWYRPPVSVYWWLKQRQYLTFILRELSSVFVALFVVMTLFQLWALKKGPEAYAQFQQWLQSPLVIALSILGFFFVVFHSITWFNLTPSAMPVRLGGKRLPAFLVAAPSYVAWAVVSAIVAWLVLR